MCVGKMNVYPALYTAQENYKKARSFWNSPLTAHRTNWPFDWWKKQPRRRVIC